MPKNAYNTERTAVPSEIARGTDVQPPQIKHQIYLSCPTFTRAERSHNLELKKALEGMASVVEWVLPQERTSIAPPDPRKVAMYCFQQVRQSSLVVACLDGADADSGTCIEVGYALGLGIPVIGYRTDLRVSGKTEGLNVLLSHGVSRLVVAPSSVYSTESLAAGIINAIQDIGKEHSEESAA